MKLRDSYDWVVLGDDPGALLSGCLAARLGLSVLVLDFVERQKPLVSRSGQVLDPESSSLLGLGKERDRQGLWFRCLKHLGAASAELSKVETPAFGPEIFTPEYRVRISAEVSEVQREWNREFGVLPKGERRLPDLIKSARPPLVKFWDSIPERLTWAPKTQTQKARPARGPADLKEAIRTLKKSKVLGASLESAWFGAQGADPRSGDDPRFRAALGLAFADSARLPAASGAVLNWLALSSVAARFEGGLTSFREFLLQTAKRWGAHVPSDTRAKRLFVEDGRLVGVQLFHRGNVIGTVGGVLGSSLEQVQEQTSLSGRTWPRGFSKPPVPASWRFTLALTVHQEAIPPGISDRVIWSEEGAPPLEIEVVDPLDRGLSQPGQKFVFLRTLVPFEQSSLDPGFQRQLASRMFRQLTEVLPFLEYHVIRIFPDFRVDAREEFVTAYPYQRLEEIPLNLRCGLSRGSGTRSGIDGLFVASAEAFPELGGLGPAVAALEATAWIAHRSGIPGPFA